MTGPSLAGVVDRIGRLLPAQARVKVAIEAAGHYHRPLLLALALEDYRELPVNGAAGRSVAWSMRSRSWWRPAMPSLG